LSSDALPHVGAAPAAAGNRTHASSRAQGTAAADAERERARTAELTGQQFEKAKAGVL